MDEKPNRKKPASRKPADESARSVQSKLDDKDPQPELTKGEKQEYRRNLRQQLSFDWYAPAGSVVERQFLESAAKFTPRPDERNEIQKSLRNPKGIDRRGLYWTAVKKGVLGPVVYERAMEHQSKLDDEEWLVAFYTARDFRQKDIARRTYIPERTVDGIIDRLKKKIGQDLICDIENVGRAQIARWFLGSL